MGSDGHRIEVEELAAYYLSHVRRVQLKGPYLIGGVSGGGVVALEMAQQLLAQGQHVGALVMIDTPHGRMFLRPRLHVRLSWRQLLPWPVMLLRVAGVPPLADMGKAGRWLRKALSALHGPRKHGSGSEARHADEFRAYVYRAIDAHISAVRRYRLKPYPGKVAYFWAQDVRFLGLRDPRQGWDRVARGGITAHRFPGQHREMMVEPYVQVLASKLRACLADAEEAAAQARCERATP
jgi:thioesterase domain-containing protein